MKPNCFIVIKMVTGFIILMLLLSGIGLTSFTSGDFESNIRNSNQTRADDYNYDVFIDNVEVKDYYIVPGIYANKHYPGQDVNISTRVWNLGKSGITTPFDILMVVLDDISQTDVKYEAHLRQTVPTLAPKSYVNLNWTWQPPAKPPEDANWDYEKGNGHTFLVRVISLYEGDQNSSNNFNTTRIDIDNPKFAPAITNTVWEDYGISETPLIQKIPIGSILYLNFTVNNTASQQDFVKVDIYDLPPDWVVLPGSLPDFLQLQGNRGSDVRLRIQISRDNSLALKAVDYKINILAYSLFSPPKNDTFQFIVNLEYSPEAKFILPKDITLKPGSHLIDVTLMNIGNGRDIFTCSAEVFPASTEWKATVYSGKKTKLLKTFETTTVTIRVDVPPKRKDSYKTIIVIATSYQLPSYNTKDEYRFKVYVGQFHGVGLKLSDDVETPLQMTPSGEKAFEMILTNTGNTRDPTINLKVTDYPSGWDITFETSNIPKSGLGIGVDVDVGVLIKTPSHVLMGDYTVVISGLAGNPEQIYESLIIPITIIEVGKVKIESRPASQSGNIGDVVQYKIFIKNTGNRLDTFDISMVEETTGMYGWGKLSQTSLTLEANSSYEIVLTVTIPLNASADTNPNTPSVWEGYLIKVTAKSQNLSHVVRSVEVETFVSQFYDFDLSADALIKPVIRGTNEPVPFFILVKNRGNVKDTFEFRHNSTYKWGKLLTRYKTIQPGETLQVKFDANPPDTIGVGVYDFRVTVTSQGDPEKFRYITLKVFVSSLELSIKKILIDGKEMENDKPIELIGGNSVLITTQIKNIGSVQYDNISYLDLPVVFFDGKTTIGEKTVTYLPVDGSINVSIIWNTTLVTQDITIFVNLDPDEEIDFSSRDGLSLTTDVHVEGPVIEQYDSKESGLGNLDQVLLPILTIVILGILQALMIMIIIRKKRERVRVGYTADGEYKPFADVFEPFTKGKLEGEDAEHPYRVSGADELESISIAAPDRLMLPPASFTSHPTKPVIKTKPLPRLRPVRRRKR